MSQEHCRARQQVIPSARSIHRALAMTAVLAAGLGPAPAAHAQQAVIQWNQIAATATLSASPALAPVQQTRAMAIVQVAVHDAVNALTGEYATYLRYDSTPAPALPEAAAIAAAHHALRTLFPGQTASLDALFASSLATYGVSEADPGVAFGRAVAAAILDLRANDGAAAAQFDYTVPGAGAPGVWERLGGAPALLPGWGQVTPWVLRSGSQFRPEAPPSLDSERWARDHAEVKEIGALNSPSRTSEQTDMAMFWRASPTAIWNRTLQQVIVTRTFSVSAAARVFALFYLAAADASIACWEAKYVYNFWRPEAAIHKWALDGNPDPSWRPLLATPPHPEYPSGHTANSGAMVAVLRHVFGDAPGLPITLTFSGVTRQWHTFGQGLQEVIDARVYSGFHFRTADVVGARLGRQVAQFVLTHALRPLTSPSRP